MYRILLVDDEPAVLNGLHETISWTEYGFETVTLAASGSEALSLLKQQSYDVILTDICMPDMDGLSLLKEVRTAYPSMSCIILTAYSEFDYVLQALRLGIDNFLLKPVNPTELIATLRQSLEKHTQHTESSAADSLNFTQNVLYRWMTGSLTGEELDNRAEASGINLFCRNYNIIAVKPVTAEININTISDTIRHTLSDAFDCYPLTTTDGTAFFIIGAHSAPVDTLFALLAPYAHSHVHILIGQTVTNCSRLSDCYQGLQSILPYAVFFDTAQPLCVESLRQKIAQKKTVNNLNNLQDLLHHQNFPDNRTQILSLLHNFFAPVTTENYSCTIIAYLDILLSELKKTQLSPELLHDFLTATIEALLPLNIKKLPYEQLLHAFEETRHLLHSEFEHTSPIIRRVIRFLKENYHQPVSLKTLAQQLSVNPSYLGYLFKEETGIYFSDFLNNLRQQHAEALLLHTNYTISEIAERTGYTTTAYFNQIFKKSHSMSPAKYRQTNKNIDET